jgi:16S rRNA (uracil1498-N3)-methyltransferase
MHRFFVSDENLAGGQVVLTGQQAHQIRNVLRARPGDHIIVLDNTGYEYVVAITDVAAQRVVGRVMDKQPAQGEPRTKITLYQSLLARGKFEWVLQKCTEVGVTRFVPVLTQRSIVRRADTITPRRLVRFRSIVTEAAEQSGRGRIPQLECPISLADALARLGAFDRCLIASPQGDSRTLRELLQAGHTEPVAVALLIGPEGGFANEELEAACAAGAIRFSLGPRILRTETAAVVASALILYELER